MKNNPTCDFNIINTDKNSAYTQAIKELKRENRLSQYVAHHQIKYCNNRLESHQGKLKQIINSVKEFHSMKTAYVTTKEFKVMHMFRKGQFDEWMYETNEISFINKQFGFTVEI
ncbi:DDE-type integrase/transposase/recombinase [Legionella sp. D16C41]|uniref:DDE-type integrase/transposase/recombinase n=1 Tax=Legionella sp. D16C41 TaxID=3402688 RepID=UPI003AF86F07